MVACCFVNIRQKQSKSHVYFCRFNYLKSKSWVFLLNTFRVVDRMNQKKNPSFNKKMTQSQKGDKDEEVGQSLTSLIGISYHICLMYHLGWEEAQCLLVQCGCHNHPRFQQLDPFRGIETCNFEGPPPYNAIIVVECQLQYFCYASKLMNINLVLLRKTNQARKGEVASTCHYLYLFFYLPKAASQATFLLSL